LNRKSAPIITARTTIMTKKMFFLMDRIISILSISLNREIIVAIDHQQ